MDHYQPYYKSYTALKFLKIIFSQLKQEVTLATIVDYDNIKTLEMKDFIIFISHLSKYIRTEIYEKEENREATDLFHADKLPVLALLESENYYSGVKFHGIPDQYALTAFALTVYHLSGAGEKPKTETAEKIAAIDQEINIKVLMNPSCMASCDAIVSAQRLALLNPKIEAEAVDINVFPHFKNNYGITKTPALIINQRHLYYDLYTIDQILDVLINID